MTKYAQEIPERQCRATRTLLSEYVDNTLSARQVLEVEKHLRDCKSCSNYRRELQITVDLLHTTPRYDTSDGFMLRLHERIDAVEANPVRRSSWRLQLQEQWNALLNSRQRRSLSALGVALIMLALVPRLYQTPPSTLSEGDDRTVREARRLLTQPLSQNVATAATEPLDDPAATNLEAQVALNEPSGSKVTKED